jgi:glycosyltransferase involved in cell wall biosynthesis
MSKTIIHQLSLSDIGGVQKSFNLYLPYALKKSSFNHYIYSMHDVIDDYNFCKNYHFNIDKSLLNKIKFIYFLFSKNHIIHFYNKLGSRSINRLLNIIPSSNIVFHERGSAWNANIDDIKIYKKNALKAKIIIANSIASKIILVKKFGINKNKIKVIYNGFFKKNYNFKPKNKRYSKRFSVGYIGRLDTPKGVHILIESAKKLTKYNFFIAGKGVLEKRLKDSAKKYKNIKFLGSFKNPLNFISKMDVIVVPSIREPFGNIIVEAGFCKKPVIATNIDGIPEIIKNGISGILIDPVKKISRSKILENSVPLPLTVVNPKTLKLQKPKEINSYDLSETIKLLQTRLTTRRIYSKNLHLYVREKFNIETYFKKLESIYKNL